MLSIEKKSYRPAHLLKKMSQPRMFLLRIFVNFRTDFFQNSFRWLVLKYRSLKPGRISHFEKPSLPSLFRVTCSMLKLLFLCISWANSGRIDQCKESSLKLILLKFLI